MTTITTINRKTDNHDLQDLQIHTINKTTKTSRDSRRLAPRTSHLGFERWVNGAAPGGGGSGSAELNPFLSTPHLLLDGCEKGR
jgi:hypothetical protein